MNSKQSITDLPRKEGEKKGQAERNTTSMGKNKYSKMIEFLTHAGLGKLRIRIGTHALSLSLILVVVWLMTTFYHQDTLSSALGAQAARPITTSILNLIPVPFENIEQNGIYRRTLLHTTIPTRPRIDVITYKVQPGDTLFGIAERYGLNPRTLLFGNWETLRDDPHLLRPEQILNILPVDGVYYQWQGTETLTGVAQSFGVDPEAIINFAGNHLDLDTIGEYDQPNITPETWLVVPGGTRLFTNWQAPAGVTRDKPASSLVYGPGVCGKISGGAVGYGTFVWPTPRHFLSGYDYSPDTNHWGIDLAGDTGNAIYATDAGVIVYAGWNTHGYGNLVLIDHGNGWQSLYAHLDSFLVVCGQSVGQGEQIGYMGSTGNSSGSHLHFEIMHTQYGKINPWNMLPPP